MATLYSGTSGFAYPAWKPAFYPAKLPAKQFLKHYSERLNCVEINYTFRRLPSASTLASHLPSGSAESSTRKTRRVRSVTRNLSEILIPTTHATVSGSPPGSPISPSGSPLGSASTGGCGWRCPLPAATSRGTRSRCSRGRRTSMRKSLSFFDPEEPRG